MPYKRNPMQCERICGLARFVMSLINNPLQTAATQWLERTLDDSANRRLALPESFLALDGALDLMQIVAGGLVVHEKTIRANLMAELPFMASENIMMAAVRSGADRQEAHELIRQHSQAVARTQEESGSARVLHNDYVYACLNSGVFCNIPQLGILSWSHLPQVALGCWKILRPR